MYILSEREGAQHIGYHHRKWSLQPEFKSWARLFALHFTQMPLRKPESIYYASKAYWVL